MPVDPKVLELDQAQIRSAADALVHTWWSLAKGAAYLGVSPATMTTAIVQAGRCRCLRDEAGIARLVLADDVRALKK